jgi:hypothetical protein
MACVQTWSAHAGHDHARHAAHTTHTTHSTRWCLYDKPQMSMPRKLPEYPVPGAALGGHPLQPASGCHWGAPGPPAGRDSSQAPICAAPSPAPPRAHAAASKAAGPQCTVPCACSQKHGRAGAGTEGHSCRQTHTSTHTLHLLLGNLPDPCAPLPALQQVPGLPSCQGILPSAAHPVLLHTQWERTSPHAPSPPHYALSGQAALSFMGAPAGWWPCLLPCFPAQPAAPPTAQEHQHAIVCEVSARAVHLSLGDRHSPLSG